MPRPSFDDLQGKVCAVTGGSGVIGRALCEGLAATGVQVAVIGRRIGPAGEVVKSLRTQFAVRAIAVEGDVLDREALVKVRERIRAELGTIDLLVNCAGGNSPTATTQAERLEPNLKRELEKTFYGLPIEEFRKVIDLNLMGTVLPTMILTEDMLQKGRGAVLNVSSMAAFHPLTKIPAYSAAKAAVNNFTEWLAVHLAPVNVRVNAIAPGFFLTQQNQFLLTDAKTGSLTPRGNRIIASTPMGRFGSPEDLQGAALYLLSDLSRFVTGVVIPIDGGFRAYPGV